MVQVSWFLWSHFFLLVFSPFFPFYVLILFTNNNNTNVSAVFLFYFLVTFGHVDVRCHKYFRCYRCRYNIFLIFSFVVAALPRRCFAMWFISPFFLSFILILLSSASTLIAHVLVFVVIGVVKHYIILFYLYFYFLLSRIASLSSHFPQANA